MMGLFGGSSSPGPSGIPVKEGTGVSLDDGGISSPGPRCGNPVKESTGLGSGALSKILFGGSSGPKPKNGAVGVGAGALLEKREGNTTGPSPPGRIGSSLTE